MNECCLSARKRAFEILRGKANRIRIDETILSQRFVSRVGVGYSALPRRSNRALLLRRRPLLLRSVFVDVLRFMRRT